MCFENICLIDKKSKKNIHKFIKLCYTVVIIKYTEVFMKNGIKKITVIFLVMVLVFSVFSCDKPGVKLKDDIKIRKAITLLKESWKDDKNQYLENGVDTKAKIVYTQIVWFGENNDENFENVECIVEFDVHTTIYTKNDEYYYNAGYKDTVVFYKDGTTEIRDIIKHAHAQMMSYDFLERIEEVNEYGDKYNCELV